MHFTKSVCQQKLLHSGINDSVEFITHQLSSLSYTVINTCSTSPSSPVKHLLITVAAIPLQRQKQPAHFSEALNFQRDGFDGKPLTSTSLTKRCSYKQLDIVNF